VAERIRVGGKYQAVIPRYEGPFEPEPEPELPERAARAALRRLAAPAPIDAILMGTFVEHVFPPAR
jgi:hypothetical protein